MLTMLRNLHSTKLILRDFPFVPVENIRNLLGRHNHLLLPTYLALERIIFTWNDTEQKPWRMRFEQKNIPRISSRHRQELAAIIDRFKQNTHAKLREFFEELQAARAIRASRDRKRSMEREMEEEEKRIDREAEERGEVSECQCCFIDYPDHRMVHCNGEEEHVSPSQLPVGVIL